MKIVLKWKRNCSEALNYYKLAADKGRIEPIYSCGMVHNNGWEAASYLKMEADREHVPFVVQCSFQEKNSKRH